MKGSFLTTRAAVTLALGAALPMFAATAAHAATPLRADACWIRSMPASVPSAGYFTIHNDGDAPRALTGIATPAYGMAMMHRTESNGSASKMVGVDRAPVPPHGELSFAPGSYHAMLEAPKSPLKIGSKTPLTLSFDDGSHLDVQCDVRSPASMGPAGASDAMGSMGSMHSMGSMSSGSK